MLLQKYKVFSFKAIEKKLPLGMRLILALFLCFSWSLQSQENDSWKLRKDKKDILVYTRSLDSTPIREYKAQMTVDASVNHIVNYILDLELMKEWNQTVEIYEIIGKRDGKNLVYMENQAPWPIENRDHVATVDLQYFDDGSAKIILNGLDEELVPIKKGVVRMTTVKGSWTLEPQNGKTKVTQKMYGDPEGNIPIAFVNVFMANSAYKTFKALRIACEKNNATNQSKIE